ncbi:hypothetical protein NC99_01880 [Sunxiuqinia dokdonensis]|uniref:Uncharacterized protein n=1 Tax=Sunxiuqinia dokdonensis TaxID=1409788 RepID=A0A0L8VEV4_9BACT|nr:hypothetical protein NC99_01880 [Sunxiuqinia dokdonensis]
MLTQVRGTLTQVMIMLTCPGKKKKQVVNPIKQEITTRLPV